MWGAAMGDPTLLARNPSGARISTDGRYRWVLWRTWDDTKPALGWIMLNPSTADHREDDPTIRRCIGFAKRDGYGGIRVANLFGLRATDPRALLDADDPIGRDTIGAGSLNADGSPHYYDPWSHLIFAVSDVVLAWGALDPSLRGRAAEVAADPWPDKFCLGTTKYGHPRHPLYVKGDARLIPWGATDG